MSKVKAVPEGYHAVTPFLVLHECAKAIDFYKKAFGAEERSRMPGPGGKIMHAELKIGNSMVMMNDEMPEMGPDAMKSPKALGGSPIGIMIYCEDADAMFKRATAAGAKVKMPIDDMFWGDRYGQVEDPFGIRWSIATHTREVSPEEMKRAMEEMAKRKR